MIFPHGIFMVYHKDLSSLWLLKVFRLMDLVSFISTKQNKFLINSLIGYKQQKALNDYELRYTMDQDYNYISEKILMRELFKTCSIFIQFVFVVYLVGNVWMIFVIVVHNIKFGHEAN